MLLCIVYLFILYTTFNGVKVRDLKKNNSYSTSLFGVFALSVLHYTAILGQSVMQVPKL